MRIYEVLSGFIRSVLYALKQPLDIHDNCGCRRLIPPISDAR